MISNEKIEEWVAGAWLRRITVSDEDVLAWAEQSGARLAVNDNYQLEADPEVVAPVLVEFLSWCARHGVDPTYDDEKAIPAMETLLGLSGLHPALMTEAMGLSDAICASLPEGFHEEEWDDFSNVSSMAIGF
jgi:hypothetical protein